MTAPVDAMLDTMIHRLVDAFGPARIYLFGSRSRGDDRPDSDYDLLVVVDECPDRRRAAVAMRDALRDLSAGKDIIVVTEAELAGSPGLLVSAAQREGTAVYERT
jgi:predicted nucleotidyltransferase